MLSSAVFGTKPDGAQISVQAVEWLLSRVFTRLLASGNDRVPKC